jgi:hypothetical protein
MPIVLNDTDDTLEVKLSGAGTIPCHATSLDAGTSDMDADDVDQHVVDTAGTANTTLVSSPAASTKRIIRTIVCRNDEGSDVTLTIQLFNGTTRFELWEVLLNDNDTFTYDDDGAKVTDSAGRLKTTLNTDHTIASHSDTTATGAELETLTDGSNADALHAHAAGPATATLIDVENNTGGQLDLGVPVYISGFDAPSGNPEASKADADSGTTMPAIGLVNADIADSASGSVVVSGSLTGLDTSSFSNGDVLYVSAGTAGTLTNVKPTGTNLIQAIAVVGRSHVTLGEVKIIGVGIREGLPNLPDTNIWVGNGSGVPAEVAVSGDASLANTGALTVAGTHSGSAHHTESHAAASHSDQGATGAELETLTDGSDADALHSHSGASLNDTPGGELGGTWGSPTVDATHSGSAHHAASHTVASHSDTTATGAELETLTDGSNAVGLHEHNIEDLGNLPVPIAEGGSNNVRLDPYISAGAMIGNVTSGAGDTNGGAERWELGTTVKSTVTYLEFTDNEKATFEWAPPEGWNLGTVTFLFYWGAPSGSGTVILGLRARALANDDSLNPDTIAFGTQVTVTDTLLATDDVQKSSESTAVTIANTPAQSDYIHFEIEKTGGTLATMRLLGMKIFLE